ncbi:MAG: pseudouridine-5'-phosphate glycosidase [Saprospiraceae bacterium]|nr:pseudouridine-5'-phosphate glycosidase [Saprospiraceae bacterium]
MQEYIIYSEEVQDAKSDNRPIVALESTIIAHGMPFPENAQTANLVEQTLRAHNAVPASIAILNGQLKVGLNEAEIAYLGEQGKHIPKISRRDLPIAIAQKSHGATTVASTMIISALAGIKVFATGGIGGVHRGATSSMDISADLQELARTNVAVVSAGAKAILDLGLTLEYLETHGVPVLGYQTKEFPAFYTRKSGLKVDRSIDTPEEVAAIMRAKWNLGLNGGLLVANPIPDKFQMEYTNIQKNIAQAIQEAAEKEIKGKAITPFLLGRIKELSQGESLKANIQLVLNNARLGAAIANAYQRIKPTA